MPRTQITLYDGDSARFQEIREAVGDDRPGSTPSNAELVRVLMDEFDDS